MNASKRLYIALSDSTSEGDARKSTVSDGVKRGVVVLPTGAWYDPLDPAVPGTLEKHGNPNVLTLDKGTSKLTQGCTAHTTLVEVELFKGELPRVTAFDPPAFTSR